MSRRSFISRGNELFSKASGSFILYIGHFSLKFINDINIIVKWFSFVNIIVADKVIKPWVGKHTFQMIYVPLSKAFPFYN